MKKAIFVAAIISLVAMISPSIAARGQSQAPPASTRDARPKARSVTSFKIALAKPGVIPITSPTLTHASTVSSPPPLPAEMMIIDRRCRIAKDPSRNWWSIPDPYAGRLYLLPCGLLQAVEKFRADEPTAMFSLSGEVHRYRGGYYLLIHRAMIIQNQTNEVRNVSIPATNKMPIGSTTAPTKSTTRPARPLVPAVSPDEIARKLLQGTSARPIVPARLPAAVEPKGNASVTASGVRVGKPIKASAGKVVANRLVRLLPPSKQDQWYKVAFKGDNTLREPPMRVLPNRQLERMRAISKDGEKPGVLFYISGEVHQYHGENYILIRSAVKKRDLDLF